MVKMRLLLGDMLLYEIYNLQWNVLQMSEMITFLVLKHWDVLFPCACVQGFPCSVTKSCQTLYYYMDCCMLGFLSFTVSQSLLKLMSTESMIPSNHLILWCPFSLGLSLSHHQCLFQWVGSSHQAFQVLELQHQSFQWTRYIQTKPYELKMKLF